MYIELLRLVLFWYLKYIRRLLFPGSVRPHTGHWCLEEIGNIQGGMLLFSSVEFV